MLSGVEHEKSFIASGPVYCFYTGIKERVQLCKRHNCKMKTLGQNMTQAFVFECVLRLPKDTTLL